MKKVSWYSNGQKESEGTFKDGLKDRKWTYWYENGQKKEEITYKDGFVKEVKSINVSQLVVGKWTLNSVSAEINSKDGEEGVDETEQRPFSDLSLSDYSLSMNEDNTFDEMWVTDDGDTTNIGGTWELNGVDLKFHQTMRNGFEDDEEHNFEIKIAPTGNMITWSRVDDLDNDGEDDDVFMFTTYRSK